MMQIYFNILESCSDLSTSIMLLLLARCISHDAAREKELKAQANKVTLSIKVCLSSLELENGCIPQS